MESDAPSSSGYIGTSDLGGIITIYKAFVDICNINLREPIYPPERSIRENISNIINIIESLNERRRRRRDILRSVHWLQNISGPLAHDISIAMQNTGIRHIRRIIRNICTLINHKLLRENNYREIDFDLYETIELLIDVCEELSFIRRTLQRINDISVLNRGILNH